MKVYITGFPGTGKTAVANMLRHKGYTVYDVDEEKDLTKWVNKATGNTATKKHKGAPDFYDKYDFCWNREHLKNMLGIVSMQPVFVVGLTSNQTEDLDLFTKVFLLRAPKNILRQRMVDRKKSDITKGDEDVDGHFSWLQLFNKEMLKHGAISINASKPLKQVVQEIESITLQIPN